MRVLLLLAALCTAPAWAAETVPVRLDARLTAQTEPLRRGLTWRVFREAEDAAGADEHGLELAATATEAVASMALATGTYYVHASFGRSGVTQRLDVENAAISRSLVLSAGGLRLDATSGGREVAPDRLSFSIYERSTGGSSTRRLVALDVPARQLIRLNAGTYHVVSRYGQVNTQVRADLVVREGEVTDATLQHRGAPVSLRLTSEIGGPPVVNTAWTVFTAQGRQVFAVSRAAPSLVLAEGSYEAVAVHGQHTLRHAFDVVAGEPSDIEVVLP